VPALPAFAAGDPRGEAKPPTGPPRLESVPRREDYEDELTMDWKRLLGISANQSQAATNSREFELVARIAMAQHYGTELQPRRLEGVPKTFDFVSPDGRVVGDAKFLTMVGGDRLPPAKFSGVAEYVWLLEKTEAARTFLIFGNDRRVPEEWLSRYGHLAPKVDFFFLDSAGQLFSLPRDGASGILGPTNEPRTASLYSQAEKSSLRDARIAGAVSTTSATEISDQDHRPALGRPPKNSRPLDFEDVWRRIVASEGEEFKTATGLPFEYEIVGDAFHPSRTNYRIGKSEVRKAFELVPFEGPGVINAIVRGPSYVWAILHDDRIRHGEW
jgi:hypothetical protein